MDNTTYTILTTRVNYTYADYVDYCEINEIEPAGEDSNEFYQWCGDEANDSVECELLNLEYSKAKYFPFYIDGTLGLWNGDKDGHFTKIYWGVKEAIWATITSTRGGYDDYEAELDTKNGVIYVNCYHHDGCNRFTIHRLSQQGEAKIQRDIENGNINDYEYEPKGYCFKKLKKEELWG